MANELVSKWAKYYEDNGLQWLSSQHVAAIKQAFFAGADAVEQPLALDTLYDTVFQKFPCQKCGATNTIRVPIARK